MRHIQVLAPAKINLFLKILNRRRDGYHNIETVFEKISLFDKLKLKEIAENKIIVNFKTNKSYLLANNSTVHRAISLLKKQFKIKKGVNAYIEKQIPIGGGLGGGSSDAAAVLKGLNRLWKLGMTKKELLEFASDIGSDVPLFILKDNFLLAEGRGEVLSVIPGTKNLKLWHILVVPDFKISTPFAYQLFDRHFIGTKMAKKTGVLQEKLRLTIPAYSANIITCALFNRDVSLLNYYSYNSFRSVILKQFARLFRLSKELEKISGGPVHLSGSGSTLFMTFSNRKEAEYLVRKIKKTIVSCSIFVVHTC